MGQGQAILVTRLGVISDALTVKGSAICPPECGTYRLGRTSLLRCKYRSVWS